MSRLAPSRPALRAGPHPPGRPVGGPALIVTGSVNSDGRLGGGLLQNAVHEFFADTPDDGCATMAFALGLALRGCRAKPVAWVREDRGERRDGRIYAPGLVELGADPDALLLVTTPDTLSLLRAGADVVDCAAVGAVILEPWARAAAYDLTASRRLALAAARSGVMTLVVRSGVEPAPSAAQTRWRVNAAPSRTLAANAPGPPAFDISLLRHRAGIAGFDARVEWDRDRRAFTDAPLSGGVSASAAGRTGVAGALRAA